MALTHKSGSPRINALQQAQRAIIHTGAGEHSVLMGGLQRKEGVDRINDMADVKCCI